MILTEPTNWLGGQLTSQAVPPDEHPWIESAYGSASYRRLRDTIRQYYRRNYPLTRRAFLDPLLNPGLGLVSQLCHEPRVAVAAIDGLLASYRASGRLTMLLQHTPITAHTDGDHVAAITFRNDRADGGHVTVSAPYVADASELGDLLPLAGVEHTFGAESRHDTGEMHAPDESDPRDQQAFSWCYALDYLPGENHVIDRPASYAYWRDHVPSFWPGPKLSWTDLEPWTLTPRTRPIFVGDTDRPALLDLWHYRRILARTPFESGSLRSDVTLVNWPQMDYWDAPLLGVDEEAQRRALTESRDLSLALLYWMQTEAPRIDGGTGYPGLRIRPDITDTEDGLAKAPYVREARRIRALFTITEEHIGAETRGPLAGAEPFWDAVGIGCYRIDLHPSASGRNYVDIGCYPFQIPLGALIPERFENLLPANKNIGTTHVTNGAYRLHPVEWSIGEAVGALVAFCLEHRSTPRAVRDK